MGHHFDLNARTLDDAGVMSVASLRFGATFLLSFAVGCTNYIFEPRVPESVKEVNRVVAAGKPTPADILFVVDNSGSMADEQELVARNFDAFINEIAGKSGDYQMAIVTTDLDSPDGERQGLITYATNPTAPYYVDINRPTSNTCAPAGIAHGCFRGTDAANRIIKSAQLTPNQQIQVFRDNVRVGSCGWGTEKGLGAMVAALEAPCNDGFLRANANLVVVFVTDEEDGSPGDVASFVTRLSALKSPGSTRIAAIVGSRDGAASRCSMGATCGSHCAFANPPTSSGTSCSNASQCLTGESCSGNVCVSPAATYFGPFCWWCSYFSSPDCCTADQGGRYVDFTNQMGAAIRRAVPDLEAGCTPPPGKRAACLIDSICQSSFEQTLIRIARDLVLTNEFVLDPPATYPEGVTVIINDVKLTRCATSGQTDCDYTVRVGPDGTGTGLVISGANAPKEGDKVEIYYAIKEE